MINRNNLKLFIMIMWAGSEELLKGMEMFKNTWFFYSMFVSDERGDSTPMFLDSPEIYKYMAGTT
jgi:hypothetical protein